MKKIFSYFPLGPLILLGYLFGCLAMTTTNITTDQFALLALRAHITSDPHQSLSKNWSAFSPVCQWIGVTCGSRHHRVIALNVSNMDLSGTISPQLGNLSFLVSLDMSNNKFHGELPQELSRLRRLRLLKLAVNNLYGELPSWFGSLPKLNVLSLRNNSFTGSIPPSIFNISTLEILQLSFNSLRGILPKGLGNHQNLKALVINFNELSGSFPVDIFNISSLEIIAFQGNSLSGSLPINICQHLPILTWLDTSSNKLSGQIPTTLSVCSELQVLGLSFNDFTGAIPRDIGNLKELEELYLHDNHLKAGTIPEEICNLSSLKILSLGFNSLTGSIPAQIFNMSTLQVIILTKGNLSGNLPTSIGYGLHNLESLYLDDNELDGAIPFSISNASKLSCLYLYNNKFSGPIPNSIGDLRFLRKLAVGQNYLTSAPSSLELSIINSLTNCKYLTVLTLNDNPLTGILPRSVGNLSASLERIYAHRCEIMGNIPDGFGNLSNLLLLNLDGNHLIGSVPTTFRGLEKLQGLTIANNQLSGTIPQNVCGLKNLFVIRLSQNQISGPIPSCIGNVTSLRFLILDQNFFNSSIPFSLWNLNDLLQLVLSFNSLSGSLPEEIQNLKSAIHINLSANQISGIVPSAIGGLQTLVLLSLAQNRLQGLIPNTLGHMLSLEFLDLSYNNFTGLIPKSLEALSYLKYINLSFNQLRGEIPSGGPFKNFTSESFIGNDALCGAPKFLVPRCSPSPVHRSNGKKVIIPVVSGVVAAIMIAIALAILCFRYQRNSVLRASDALPAGRMPESISYNELLQATDGYSESNLLGMGSFGSVYKGTLVDGALVAVKVFHLQLEEIVKSYITECEVLCNLRHRNLTKVISICSNHDFKAIVLEYMPNGSLEKWLYSHNQYLDIIQRISIMIDVANALEYLHYGYEKPVVHCDIKPSNILLNEDLVAHVSDFGIAKYLSKGQSDLHTKTLATMGYIAPEYGSEGLVSTRTDVYSFGIVLMETFSRVKPSDEMFSGDLTIKSWIKDSLHCTKTKVIDAHLLSPEDEHFTQKLENISQILELALSCCAECPKDRINMKEVVISLEKIKHQVVKCLWN